MPRKLNKTGFTLIELLVVISILAILAMVGTLTYSSSQQKARDAKRMEDVQNLAKALEAGKDPYGGNKYKNKFHEDDFSEGIPVDPGHNGVAQYVILYRTDVYALTRPVTWANTSEIPVNACSTPANCKIETVSNGRPLGNPTSWLICALLEQGSNPGNIFCISDLQGNPQ